MEYGAVPGLDKPVSRIAFGTAIRTMMAGADADDLLDAAVEAGINAFDTARGCALAGASSPARIQSNCKALDIPQTEARCQWLDLQQDKPLTGNPRRGSQGGSAPRMLLSEGCCGAGCLVRRGRPRACLSAPAGCT